MTAAVVHVIEFDEYPHVTGHRGDGHPICERMFAARCSCSWTVVCRSPGERWEQSDRHEKQHERRAA